MSSLSLSGTEILTWVIIPLLIFFARICDVSLSTIRIIFIGRGYKFIAPLLGFVQVLIWLFAIRQIMQNLNIVFYYVAYAGGFAAGTFVGMYMEEKLAIGILSIRIITRKDASGLIDFLRSANYGVTSVEGEGATGKVHIIYTIVNRRDVQNVIKIVNKFNPKAFYLIEDIRHAKEGIFPMKKSPLKRNYRNLARIFQKEE